MMVVPVAMMLMMMMDRMNNIVQSIIVYKYERFNRSVVYISHIHCPSFIDTQSSWTSVMSFFDQSLHEHFRNFLITLTAVLFSQAVGITLAFYLPGPIDSAAKVINIWIILSCTLAICAFVGYMLPQKVEIKLNILGSCMSTCCNNTNHLSTPPLPLPLPPPPPLSSLPTSLSSPSYHHSQRHMTTHTRDWGR